MNDELKESDIEFRAPNFGLFELGEKNGPNPAKPKGPKTFYINRLVEKWQKQTQKVYCPCNQLLTVTVAPFSRNLEGMQPAPSQERMRQRRSGEHRTNKFQGNV